MKGISWRQSCLWIEAKDLVEQNCFDADMTIVCVFSDFNVRLIPREAEAPLKVRIRRLVGLERAALHGKEIEGKSRLESIEIQD